MAHGARRLRRVDRRARPRGADLDAHADRLRDLAAQLDAIRETGTPASPPRPAPVDALLDMAQRLTERLAGREAPWDRLTEDGACGSSVERTVDGYLVQLRASITGGER